MKNFYLILLCGLMFATNVNAQTWNIGVGADSASVTATASGPGHHRILTISGTGAMKDWDYYWDVPWYDQISSI